MENSKLGSRSLVNLKLIRVGILNEFNLYMQYQTIREQKIQQAVKNASYSNHHLTKSNEIHSFEKLTVK